jgi:hypothetical protein
MQSLICELEEQLMKEYIAIPVRNRTSRFGFGGVIDEDRS